MQDYVILYRTAYLFLSGFILLVQGQWKSLLEDHSSCGPEMTQVNSFCRDHCLLLDFQSVPVLTAYYTSCHSEDKHDVKP